MHKWPLIAIIFGPVIALGLAFVAMHRGEPQHVVTAPAATASAKPSTTSLAVTAPTTEPATVAAPVLTETKAPPPAPGTATHKSSDEAAAPPSTNNTPPPPVTNPNTASQPPTPATPSAEQLYAQGLDLFVNGKAQDARRYFTEAIRADPRNAKAHFRLGEIALLNRNFDHADDQFTRALANADHLDSREHSLCDLGLAIAHDDRPEANRIAREIQNQNPGDPDLASIQSRFGAFFGRIEERPRVFPRRRRQP
jgi:TolA-binding protein